MNRLIKFSAVALALGLSISVHAKPDTAFETKQLNLLNKASDLLDQGQLKQSLKLLKQVTDKMPKGWKPHQESANKVKIAYWDDEYADACKAKDESLSGKTVVDSRLSYSRAYYLQGYIEVERDNLAQAMIYINKGLALEPDSPRLHGEKGSIYLQMANNEAAVLERDMVLESTTGCVLDSDKAFSLFNKGVSLIDLNRLDEAETALKQSLEYGENPDVENELDYIAKIRSGEIKPTPASIQKTTQGD